MYSAERLVSGVDRIRTLTARYGSRSLYTNVSLHLGFPGSLQVVHYDLNPSLWGDNEKEVLLRMADIYHETKINNALVFDLLGIHVDFNKAQVTFRDNFNAHDICVKIATAFAVATLQVCHVE